MRRAVLLISSGFVLVMIGILFLVMETSSVDVFFFVFPFFFLASSGSAETLTVSLIMIFIITVAMFLCISTGSSLLPSMITDEVNEKEVAIYCPNCYAKLNRDSLFCHKCGERVAYSE